MANPCPQRIKARAVLAKTGAGALNKDADRIPVAGVSISVDAETIDRSDVYTPDGLGLGSIVSGRRYQFTITQELFANFDYHEVLIRACPVVVTNRNTTPTIKPAVSMCSGTGYAPATIEIVETGGNVYHAEDCVGVFTATAAPGNRIMLEFTMTGTFTKPTTDAYGTLSPIVWGLPVTYKNAKTQYFSDKASALIDLTSCPSFTFTPGMETIKVPSACTPDGGGFSYPMGTGPATLAYSGVLARKNADDHLWDESVDGGAGRDLVAILNNTGAPTPEGPTIKILDYTLQDPSLGDSEGLIAYDLTFEGAWELVWPSQVAP